MRTQKEINHYLQRTTIKNVRHLLDIESCIRNNNLRLPNNVIIHENGISSAEFCKWFENRCLKEGDICTTVLGITFIYQSITVSNMCGSYVSVDNKGILNRHYNSFPEDCCCLATKEEKQKLFDAIKAKGYKWNSKTKTLEKLIIPIFKKGDKVRVKNGISQPRTIEDVCDTFYTLVPIGKIDFTDQDRWELVPNMIKPLNDVHSIYECKTTGQGTYAIKIADGYKFDSIDENGNIIVRAIKPKYPTTYKECCDVLLIPPYYNLRYHTYERGCNELATSNELLSLQDKLNTLGKLIICRNAYWKIAGKEMSLDGPWKADWNDQRPKYTITVIGNQLIKHHSLSQNYILTFPTEEIRDAFYENFKDLIEQCKELL